MDCMNIRLDRYSGEPLHIQLAGQLRRCILDSGSSRISRLPSERSLCEKLNLNRATVHRAYETLINDGIVTSCPNRQLAVAPQARRLLAGAFPSIGVLLPEPFSVYTERNNGSALRYLKGIFDRAAELECSVFMLQIPAPGTPEAEVKSFIDSNFHKLIGIIHLGGRENPVDTPLETVFRCTQLPQIFISGTSQLPHIGSVYSDFTAAGKELAQALLECSCRKVGIVYAGSGNDNPGTFDYSVHRRHLIMGRIFEEAGLEIVPEWTFPSVSGRPLEEKLLGLVDAGKPLPNAFWCGNDAYAMELCSILKKRGIRIPEDVKLAGFDGILKDGFLATIEQRFSAIGAGAVELLLEHFDHGISALNRVRTVEAVFVPGKSLQKIRSL